MHAFIVRPILASDTHNLRLRVLRPGQPPERADYATDKQADAFHLGAFTADGLLAGVASFYHEAFPHDAQQPYYDENPSDWRLRGMAVEPDIQGQGVGRALIVAGVEILQAKGGVWLWCNARTTAEPFYTTLGFDTFGDPL